MTDEHAHDNPLVLDHFLNPRNVGDLPDADGVGEVGAVACGDVMRISIKVRDGRIAEARFRTFGCGTSIATSSITTELIRGRTVEEAQRLAAAEGDDWTSLDLQAQDRYYDRAKARVT